MFSKWAAKSPDLAACDFFLYGYLMGKVYWHRPMAIDQQKTAAIQQEITTVWQEMTRSDAELQTSPAVVC